jgi:molybdenum cofactor cytidylyltransferase
MSMSDETIQAPAVPLPASKVAAVLLAAGLSSRMGARNKLLIDIAGEPLVRRVARAYLAAGVDVYAVLGHESDAVRAALAGLPLSFVENPRHREGKQSSVRAGLDSLPATYDAVMVALGDQAALTPDDIGEVLRAFASSGRDHILIPFHNGERGNPVMFPATIVARIRASGPEATAGNFIDTHPHLTHRYETASDHFIIDIDTPDDLIRFEQRSAAARD